MGAGPMHEDGGAGRGWWRRMLVEEMIMVEIRPYLVDDAGEELW